jgi:hypothetical protein
VRDYHIKAQDGEPTEARLQEIRWFCYQYPEWASSGTEEGKAKMKLVEDAVSKVTNGFAGIKAPLLLHITNRNISMTRFQKDGLPCGKSMFYDLRRKVYILLNQRIP